MVESDEPVDPTTGIDPFTEPDEQQEGRIRRWWRRTKDGAADGCSSCDVTPNCDCDLPCDCNLLLRVSTVLAFAACLLPPVGADRAIRGLIGCYRRRLTRFTPVCPSTPSCSAYALDAVTRLGARRGLAAAAERVAACGRG